MELIDYAIAYKERGYSVIPIRYKTKLPLIKWEEYQERQATEAEIKQWFSENNSNIAIVLGRVSGGEQWLVVTEFDAVTEFEKFVIKVEEKLGYKPQEITPVIRTSRGYHVYWLVKEPTVSCHFPTVEIRSDGNYVLAPPSIHPGGTTYTSINPEVTQPFTIPSLLDIGIDVNQPKPHKEDGTPNWITQALKGVAEGQRDNTCTSLAGYFLKTHPPDIVKTILYSFADKCNPPFEHRLVDKTVDSIARKEGTNTPTGDNTNSVYTCESSQELKLNSTKIAQKAHNFGIEDIREYVASQGFRYWSTRELDYELSISSEGKQYRRRLLSYLEEQGEIEKHPSKTNWYRQINQDDIIDYKSAGLGRPLDLWLPFDLHRHFRAYSGNLIDFAGVTDAGKTALAVNIISNNDHEWTIDYWTNELSAEELNDRLQNLEPEKAIEDWNFTARVIVPGYLGKIRPDILSIFDYIDVGDPYYRIGEEQQAIHDAIGKGAAIIFLQRDEAKMLARGKGFSAQLPRLYISMDNKSAYAYKAKTPKNPTEPLKGKTCNFTLKNGVHFTFTAWEYRSME
jgi:hypothetical protein